MHRNVSSSPIVWDNNWTTTDWDRFGQRRSLLGPTSDWATTHWATTDWATTDGQHQIGQRQIGPTQMGQRQIGHH